jgi:hypothetical protein
LAFSPLAPACAHELEKPKKIPRGSPLYMLDMADALAAFGRETRNPLALTVAADLAKQAGERARVREVEHQGGALEAAAPEAEGQTPAADVLDEAVALAKGDPVILALVADVRAASVKGLSQGLGASISSVPGSGNDWYRNLPFKGGEYAETKIDVLNGGDISLFVYDAGGNLVCKDASASGRKYCGWSPVSTDKFSIKIENRGARPVRYKLVTN